MTTEYGKRLKLARKHAGLTQKELAPLAGMSQSNLSELETISHRSGYTTQLAQACCVDPHWLATGDGEMLSTQNTQTATAPNELKVRRQDIPAHGSTRQVVQAMAALIEELSPDELHDIGSLLSVWGRQGAPAHITEALIASLAALDDQARSQSGLSKRKK